MFTENKPYSRQLLSAFSIILSQPIAGEKPFLSVWFDSFLLSANILIIAFNQRFHRVDEQKPGIGLLTNQPRAIILSFRKLLSVQHEVAEINGTAAAVAKI